ncbi:MAG: GIY-YIG nuclease family protein, partial [Gallionella sp.]|nr:GIY-YIG nuclease family protein [Gallionella sp.]
MNSGIYKIEHTTSGKVYIGSAADLVKRFSTHRVALRKSKHPNSKLQRAWNKYGEAEFMFSIIEPVEEKARLIT